MPQYTVIVTSKLELDQLREELMSVVEEFAENVEVVEVRRTHHYTHALVTGSFLDGFRLHGPFLSEKDSAEFIHHHEDEDELGDAVVVAFQP